MIQRAIRMVMLMLGQKYPGKRDMLELAQVAELIRSRQAVLTGPAEGFIQPSMRDPYSCLQCRDRTHIWEKVAHIQTLCLVEQIECGLRISLARPDASHNNTPAIRVLRETSELTKFLTVNQVLHSRIQIIVFI